MALVAGGVQYFSGFAHTLVDITGMQAISVNIRQGYTHFTASGAGGRTPTFEPPKPWLAGNPKARSAAKRNVSCTLFSFSQLWYENMLVDPVSTQCHTIVSPFEYTLLLWNSSRSSTLDFALERIGWEGLEDTMPNSVTLAPLAYAVYRITVTMDGPSVIDGRLVLSNSLVGSVEHRVLGTRGVVWAFRPNAGLQELWEWKTEVNKAWAYGEERLALRVVPRLSFEANYTAAQGSDATQMELMLYDMYDVPYFLPLFEQQAEAQVHAGDSILTVDTSLTLWREGMTGILWQSSRVTELFTVQRAGQGEISLASPVTYDFGRCLVMPCTASRLTGGTARTDTATKHSVFTASWLASTPPDWLIEGTAPLMLDGVEVWDVPLYVQGGGLQRSIESLCVVLDNGLAPAQRLHTQPAALGSQQVTLYGDGVQEIMELRSRLLRRQGGACPFWASTRRHDYTLLEIVRAGSEYLVVAGCTNGLSAPAARSVRRWLCIVLSDGQQLFRAVRTVQRLDAVRDELRLTEALSSTEDIAPEQIERISFLSQYCLSSDSVRWTWQRTQRVDVSFAIREFL